MSQGLTIGAEGIPNGAAESRNLVLLLQVLHALLGKGGGLLLPDAGALGFVEHQGRRAVVGVRESVDAVVVPI